MTSYRSQLGDGDDLSHLHIATSASGCPGGTLFNMYFEREGTTQPVSLNPTPVPVTNLILPNLPAGASHGRYWAAAVNPQTGVEFKNSPAVNDGLHSTGADTGSEPGEASRNLRFAHLDHLGSTRVISDEAGEVVARLKFYPFGMEAETSGGDATRMKFTGHERDDDVHVDYMLARFYAPALARFLSRDRGPVSLYRPSSWSRFSYTENNPVFRMDPDGLAWISVRVLNGGQFRADATHHQIWYEDGLTPSNEGFYAVKPRQTILGAVFDLDYDVQGEFRAEKLHLEDVNVPILINLDDDRMRRASARVKNRWGDRYQVNTHNCQDFVTAVLLEYIRLIDWDYEIARTSGRSGPGTEVTVETEFGPIVPDEPEAESQPEPEPERESDPAATRAVPRSN